MESSLFKCSFGQCHSCEFHLYFKCTYETTWLLAASGVFYSIMYNSLRCDISIDKYTWIQSHINLHDLCRKMIGYTDALDWLKDALSTLCTSTYYEHFESKLIKTDIIYGFIKIGCSVVFKNLHFRWHILTVWFCDEPV